MASRLVAVWFLISFLAFSTVVLADCPLLRIPPAWDREQNGALPYFIVRSQADADLLATCGTFTGDLFISGSNASAPLIIPGPTYIKGTLKMLLAPQADPRLTGIIMSSLVSVSEEIQISRGYLHGDPLNDTLNVTKLSFPLLECTRWFFGISNLLTLTTLDFPRLSRAKYLDLAVLPALHTLSVPALTSVSQLSLSHLPALHALSFPGPLDSGFSSFGPHIRIYNTSLSHISGLSFASATSIEISSNKNLRLITFPSLTLASTPRDAGVSSITVFDNGNDFVLDLPKLKHVQGGEGLGVIGAAIHLFGVRTVNVPELRFVDGDLDIGTVGRFPNPRSHTSTALTNFSAPQLSKIGGSLNVGNSPLLESMRFPALKAVEGDVRISGVPAADLEEGIGMPQLRRVHGIQVVGRAPRCEEWAARRSKGVLWGGWFWCGERAKWTVEEMEHKLWEDREAEKRTLEDRFGIDDCYPYQGRWCINGKGLNWGGVGRVGCVMAVVFLGVWWVRMRRIGRRVRVG
ncbi:hypothetical protein MMC15_004427 [Xylographa vitiligo]|nr:hypothetical protein [Xylographa vitiligo]